VRSAIGGAAAAACFFSVYSRDIRRAIPLPREVCKRGTSLAIGALCGFNADMAATPGSRQPGIKPDAMKLIRTLPDDASWDDLMYHIYVRQKIEAGLADIAAGRVRFHEAVKKEFGVVS
jgi:hypothetical protein